MSTSLKIFVFVFLQFVISAFYTHFLSAQLVPDFRVNDDTTNTEQFSAKLGVDNTGIVTSVWRDQRNNNPNIYCQRFNSNGIFLGQNFRINVNPDSSGSPAVAVSSNGKFGVCWVEINGTINNSSKVKFRLYNSDAVPITSEIVVNDSNGNFSGPLSIDVSTFNEYIVTWEQKNILFQKLDSLGNKIGINTKVNDDTGNNTHKNPAITVRQDGSFIVTWEDSRPPSSSNYEDIYMQMYSKNGTPIGSNVRVSDNTVLYDKQSDPKISSDTSGRFCISFSNFNLNEVQTNVECQLYNSDGSRFGNNFIVAGSIDNDFNSAIFKKENGDMVSGFNFFTGSRFDPYFQRINSSGMLSGTQYRVSTELTFTDKFYSDLVVYNDRIISIWSDDRNGNLDIYCNIRSYINPDSTVSIQNISSEIPSDFNLLQNYPNPFNSQTKIVFEITKTSDYTLEIFNSLGSVIDIYNYSKLYPGKYMVNYDASRLPSGVYFYSINYGRSNLVRKFVLIK